MSIGSPQEEKKSGRKSSRTLRTYELALYPNPGKVEETRFVLTQQ